MNGRSTHVPPMSCVIRGRIDRKRFGAFGTEAFFVVWVQSDSGRFRLPVRESNVIL